ncbi:hypothetical protein FOL47_004517 [Perkinsus chesapeaki]|uniref:Uncharacterized protein n=1 Tax=Perkinsus chesapeaki TaxID=330153 RepID=A0A7J6M1Y8_PERCH|nr:hypothetical protein FOL47_004517 [Perkinsus chesapeaki]
MTATTVSRTERPYVSVLLLLILALQFYNPFRHYPQCRCVCDGHGVDDDKQRQVSSVTRSSDSTPHAISSPPKREDLNDLAAVRRAAEEQHAKLKEAGRLPAETEISQRAQQLLEEYRRSPGAAVPPPPPPSSGLDWIHLLRYRPVNAPAPPPPMLHHAGHPPAKESSQSISDESSNGPIKATVDFGAVLQQAQGQGIGVILGVGRGDFAINLLRTWPASAGVYLCDPYIHIWQGYKDPENHSDKDHQLIFEELRNRLAPYEGKYVLIRDFSYSFADTYRSEPNQPSPTFIFIDANHAYDAVKRDLEQWWPILASGGLMAGSTFLDDELRSIGVASAVQQFAASVSADLYLTRDVPPAWYMALVVLAFKLPTSHKALSYMNASTTLLESSTASLAAVDDFPINTRATTSATQPAGRIASIQTGHRSSSASHRYASLRASTASSVWLADSITQGPPSEIPTLASIESLPSSVPHHRRRPAPLRFNSSQRLITEGDPAHEERALSGRSSFLPAESSVGWSVEEPSLDWSAYRRAAQEATGSLHTDSCSLPSATTSYTPRELSQARDDSTFTRRAQLLPMSPPDAAPQRQDSSPSNLIEFGDTILIDRTNSDLSTSQRSLTIEREPQPTQNQKDRTAHALSSHPPTDDRPCDISKVEELTESRMNFLAEEMRSLRAQVELVQNRLHEQEDTITPSGTSESSDEQSPTDETEDAYVQCSALVTNTATSTEQPYMVTIGVMAEALTEARVSTEVQTDCVQPTSLISHDGHQALMMEQREALSSEITSLVEQRERLYEEVARLSADLSRQRKLAKTQSTTQSLTETLRQNGEIRAYHTANMRLRKQILELRNEMDAQRQVVCEAASIGLRSIEDRLMECHALANTDSSAGVGFAELLTEIDSCRRRVHRAALQPLTSVTSTAKDIAIKDSQNFAQATHQEARNPFTLSTEESTEMAQTLLGDLVDLRRMRSHMAKSPGGTPLSQSPVTPLGG